MRHHRQAVQAADGTRVAWDEAGAGGPPVLLCNGLSTNTHFWRHVLGPLEGRHRTLTFDLKGHGDSAPARTPEGASIEGVADDALRVLDAAGVERAAVVGFSMGCQVAVELHRRAPERVLAVALLLGPVRRVFDTALGPVGPGLQRLFDVLPDAALRRIMPGLARVGATPLGHGLGRRLGLVGPDCRPEDLDGIVHHWGRLHPPSLRHLARSAGRYDGMAALRDVRAPLFVVAGDRDIFAPPESVGENIVRAAPQAHYLRLPHATHASLLEHADELAAHLLGFLATLPRA